jgi:hypothetical protein
MLEASKAGCDERAGGGAEMAPSGAGSGSGRHAHRRSHTLVQSARARLNRRGVQGGLSIRGGQVGKQQKSFLSVANEGADRR